MIGARHARIVLLEKVEGARLAAQVGMRRRHVEASLASARFDRRHASIRVHCGGSRRAWGARVVPRRVFVGPAGTKEGVLFYKFVDWVLWCWIGQEAARRRRRRRSFVCLAPHGLRSRRLQLGVCQDGLLVAEQSSPALLFLQGRTWQEVAAASIAQGWVEDWNSPDIDDAGEWLAFILLK